MPLFFFLLSLFAAFPLSIFVALHINVCVCMHAFGTSVYVCELSVYSFDCQLLSIGLFSTITYTALHVHCLATDPAPFRVATIRCFETRKKMNKIKTTI